MSSNVPISSRIWKAKKRKKLVFLCYLPFLASFLTFSTLHSDLTSVRVTASYSYEGLVAMAIEPYAADRDGYQLQVVRSLAGINSLSWVGFKPPEQSHASNEASALPPSHHGRLKKWVLWKQFGCKMISFILKSKKGNGKFVLEFLKPHVYLKSCNPSPSDYYNWLTILSSQQKAIS